MRALITGVIVYSYFYDGFDDTHQGVLTYAVYYASLGTHDIRISVPFA